MPDLIRHPVPTWIPAFAGMTILRYLIAGVILKRFLTKTSILSKGADCDMKTGYLRNGVTFLCLILILPFLISCGGGVEEGLGGSITLTADPTSIPADGLSSLTITATVLDSSGSPVNDGTTVTFTTDLGGFSRSFSKSSSISVSTSGGTGVVIVSLIAGTTPGIATVTADANSITQTIKVPFDIVSSGETASITLNPDPTCIPPDGFSSSTITATLHNSSGSPVSFGTYVSFTTTFGSFPGGTSDSGWTSNDSGIVTVSLIAGTTPGTATVRAMSNNVTQAVSVTFSDNCE